MEKVTGQAVALWMLLAAIAGIVTFILYRRGKIQASTAVIIPILFFFLSFVLTITIIERVPRRKLRYNLELFWTIKSIIAGKTYLIWEIFWNVVLFIPIGLMVSVLLKHPWLAVLISVLISFNAESGRINIFKTTLVAMGYPEFFRFRFSPEDMFFGIEPCGIDDEGAKRLPDEITREHYDIKSIKLVRFIYKKCSWLHLAHPIGRICGANRPRCGASVHFYD